MFGDLERISGVEGLVRVVASQRGSGHPRLSEVVVAGFCDQIGAVAVCDAQRRGRVAGCRLGRRARGPGQVARAAHEAEVIVLCINPRVIGPEGAGGGIDCVDEGSLLFLIG